jgi:hypothetical protein
MTSTYGQPSFPLQGESSSYYTDFLRSSYLNKKIKNHYFKVFGQELYEKIG